MLWEWQTSGLGSCWWTHAAGHLRQRLKDVNSCVNWVTTCQQLCGRRSRHGTYCCRSAALFFMQLPLLPVICNCSNRAVQLCCASADCLSQSMQSFSRQRQTAYAYLHHSFVGPVKLTMGVRCLCHCPSQLPGSTSSCIIAN